MNAPASPKIFIIDDSEINLKVLDAFLKTYNWEVHTAKDGETGIGQVQALMPDLILLDIMMPGIDGFEVCRRLKQLPDVRDIPIIFISALTDTTSIIKGLELGAVDYIHKPFRHPEVITRIKLHLTLYHTSKELQQKNKT